METQKAEKPLKLTYHRKKYSQNYSHYKLKADYMLTASLEAT